MTLASCAQHDTELVEKKLLHVNVKEEPCWMDPRKGVDMIASQMHFMLFEGLYRLMPDLSIAPGMALSHELSEDQKTYTFHLRDAKWSNGDPVTAYDFEKSFKSLLDPEFPCRDVYILYPIVNAKRAKLGEVSLNEVKIHALDDKTLQIELSHPYPSFLHITALSFLTPVHMETVNKNPDWSQKVGPDFVVNGPFTLKSWEHNHEMLFEKNPRYYRKEEVKLDQVKINMVANEMSALRMYANGYFDILGAPLSPFPVASYPELIEKNLVRTTPIAGTKIVAFNVDRYPFTNAHIRRAFSLAINRKNLVKNITRLKEPIATRAIPPVIDNKRDLNLITDFSAKEAVEEFELGLKELGITRKEFPKPALCYWGSDLNGLLAQDLQQAWKKILKIDVILDKIDFKTLLAKTKSGDYDCNLIAYLAEFSDSINIFERFKDKENFRNYSNWESEEYQTLLKKCLESPEKASEYKDQMETLLMKASPFAPLYHYHYAYLIQPHVKNFKISPVGHILFDQIELE